MQLQVGPLDLTIQDEKTIKGVLQCRGLHWDWDPLGGNCRKGAGLTNPMQGRTPVISYCNCIKFEDLKEIDFKKNGQNIFVF